MPRAHQALHRLRWQLDEMLWTKLDALSQRFPQPMADVIRQMIVQQTVEQFPDRWQQAVEAHRKDGLIEQWLCDAPDGGILLMNLAEPRAAEP
jgi:hypothetical protein